MRKVIMFVALAALSGAAAAQVGTTLKEGAKATSEKAQQLGDQTKAAFESGPKKQVDQVKAKVHKAKASHHAKAAADAAKEIPK
jgi:hypothetical protein